MVDYLLHIAELVFLVGNQAHYSKLVFQRDECKDAERRQHQ